MKDIAPILAPPCVQSYLLAEPIEVPSLPVVLQTQCRYVRRGVLLPEEQTIVGKRQ